MTRRDVVDEMLGQWRRERPDLDASGMGVVLRIHILDALLSERLKEILEPLGLSPWEYDVLSALRRSGPRARLSSRELCRAAQLTSGAMTHRLDLLEERGLVRRVTRAEDRRGIEVSLTPKGLARIDRALGARMEAAAGCVDSLERADRRRLARLLREIHLAVAAGEEAR